MQNYYIAGFKARLDQYLTLTQDWKIFSCSENITDFCVKILPMNILTYGFEKGEYVLPEDIRYVFRQNHEVLLTNQNWTKSYIISASNFDEAQILLMRIFRTHAVRRQMIQLHCATIDDDGRGILFLGPSGIGKTTQAERWAQYRGSAIINGDIGFVQRTPAGYTAWGTPWHGSSPYCLNASVPVKALVVLKQAPQNALRELTGFEKVREVSGSVFYPTWLEDGMELCTDTLNHLLSDLPVYRLDNRADEEAVRLLAAEIDRIS